MKKQVSFSPQIMACQTLGIMAMAVGIWFHSNLFRYLTRLVTLDPDNTRTPLVAWGRGIRGPLPDSVLSSHDNYSMPWGLGHLYRRDVEQADVAALMATLIGEPWPINCVGVLPDVDPTKPGYLNPSGGDETKALAALVNAKVRVQFQLDYSKLTLCITGNTRSLPRKARYVPGTFAINHSDVIIERRQNFTRFYKPFAELEDTENSNAIPRVMRLKEIETLVSQNDWYNARLRSAELIDSALKGLRYLQTYDRLLISGIVTAAYLGWAAYSSLYIFQPPTSTGNHVFSTIVDLFSISALFAFWTYFVLQDSPWTFYIYILFPCYFWQQVAKHLSPAFRLWLSNGSPLSVKAMLWTVLVFAGLQSMVVCPHCFWLYER
jgi:GPI ethanolamine phosphate transferase 1